MGLNYAQNAKDFTRKLNANYLMQAIKSTQSLTK